MLSFIPPTVSNRADQHTISPEVGTWRAAWTKHECMVAEISKICPDLFGRIGCSPGVRLTMRRNIPHYYIQLDDFTNTGL